MLIQCTKKLLGEIKREPASSIEEDPLFSWHANLLRVQSKKTLILVNDKTRYLILLHGLKKGDFAKIEDLIQQAIRETFEEELIKTSIIEQYLDHHKEITFTRTKNRSMVAKLNHTCRRIPYFEELLNKNTIYQREMSVDANKYIDGSYDNYLVPKKEMYKELASLTGIPEIFSCQAAQIKATLLLENHSVWRRLVVPTKTSFRKLHSIMQIAFGWKNSHLHQFIILDDDKGPKVRIAPFELSLIEEEADPPTVIETETSLEEHIPAPIAYIYDFGDNWDHYIEVEKIIDEYDKNYPVCLEGEGNAPPEDVGGEPGYEEFLAVLSNREHEDHEWMAKWGRSQGYEEFDLDAINRRF